MFGDSLLSEQLEDDGSHQVPLVLKLQGPLVLEEKDVKQVEESDQLKQRTITKNKLKNHENILEVFLFNSVPIHVVEHL